MRISELSRRSGVPVPTIKFYLRERLLPPGTPTARNQAVYGHAHLARLRLIRVLTGMGQLSIAAAGEVLQALDNPAVPTAELYGVLGRARGVRPPATETPTPATAPAEVDALLDRCGWQVKPDGPERELLAHAVALLDGADLAVLADTAERLVARQLELLPAEPGRATLMARLVTLDAAFDALRRLAVEHHLSTRAERATPREPAPVPVPAPAPSAAA
ncbi:MerR family transcriptional regulator [Dactylosporangium sp. NPDC006015]|uniref:MerR family transcriptional regulator n=1 Tax=Dactylosporangium sp. NPDC006015 TaxID=3154576 RepID=UPI0033B6CCEC